MSFPVSIVRHVAGAVLVVVCLVGCAESAPALPEGAVTTTPTDAAPVVPEPMGTLTVPPAQADPEMQGFRIAVVVPDRLIESETMLSALRELAGTGGATLEEFIVPDAVGGIGEVFAAAVDSRPDLVIGLGAGAADVFSLEAAKLLDQQFLIVGAQLAEPTANVTAVIWDGATSRGSAAAPDGDLDAQGVTTERSRDAFAAGINSVQGGITGFVLSLD